MKKISFVLLLALTSCKRDLLWSDYNGYGNSIMTGTGSTTYEKSFMYRLQRIIRYGYKSYAIGGTGIKELNYIYYSHAKVVKTNIPIIVEIGTNNLRNSNSKNKINNLIEGLNNVIVNQFADSAISVNSKGVVKKGNWFNLITSDSLASKSSAYFSSTPQKSLTAGSTISFDWYGGNISVLSYAADFTHGFGSFKITVDGEDKITWSGSGRGDDWYYSIYGRFNFRTPAALVLTDLGEGAHKIVLTNLQNKEIDIDAFIRLAPHRKCAPIQLVHILKSTQAGYALKHSFSNDVQVGRANEKIDSLVNFYQNLGYPIASAVTENYINMKTDFTGTDGLHPNDLGHEHIEKALYDNIDKEWIKRIRNSGFAQKLKTL